MREEELDMLDLDATAGWRQLDVQEALDNKVKPTDTEGSQVVQNSVNISMGSDKKVSEMIADYDAISNDDTKGTGRKVRPVNNKSESTKKRSEAKRKRPHLPETDGKTRAKERTEADNNVRSKKKEDVDNNSKTRKNSEAGSSTKSKKKPESGSGTKQNKSAEADGKARPKKKLEASEPAKSNENAKSSEKTRSNEKTRSSKKTRSSENARPSKKTRSSENAKSNEKARSSERTRSSEGIKPSGTARSSENTRSRNTVEKKAREKNKKTVSSKKKSFFAELTAIDYAIAGIGVAIVAIAVILGSIYSSILTKRSQIDSFVPIGQELAQIGIAGESTLIAMADAKKVAYIEEPAVTEYDEKDEEQGQVEVRVVTQSVMKDLKIKFVNKKTEKLIGGVPFKVEVTDSKKKSSSYTDDDKDGVIYIKSMVPGDAKVKLVALEGYADYNFNAEPVTIKIKENIDYKKIDVSDEVKTESQVNAAKEDTAKKVDGGETLADTVEWVESSKTLIDGEVSYRSIGKEELADPYLNSCAGEITASQVYLLTVSEDIRVNEEQPVTEEQPATEPSTEEEKKAEPSTEESSGEEQKEKKEPDADTPLKDKSGNPVYIYRDGEYVEAKYSDYNNYSEFFLKNSTEQYKYTGWQEIDGSTYYFTSEGEKVTGDQVIQGVRYSFGDDGALKKGSGTMGIDVSKWNGSIDWNKVKNAGVSYVIIRCGYRGSTTGALIEDPTFRKNIQGASAAGLKVGIYFFSQATNEVEAVEEASMTLGLIGGYKISYPVFLDVEPSGGRGDAIDSSTRTQVINAYCQTIRNSGYSAGVYANKNWLSEKFNPGALSGCKIWMAQYTSTPSYSGRYDMWQYSSRGSIAGISGKVDMNLSYF